MTKKKFIQDIEPLGTNDTQKDIFKAIFNKPRTKSDIAKVLDVSEKTIANNIAFLKKLVDKEEGLVFLKNYNSEKDTIFSVWEKKELAVEIKPKIYSYARSSKYPYIVINLPAPPEGYDHWSIVTFGDTHYGADTCNVKIIQEFITMVKDTPNMLAILKGDLIENATRESPGTSVYTQLIPPQEQRDRFITMFAPIAHKILYSVRGNHGYRSVKGAFLDPERDISNALKVEYFKGACYADIVCEDKSKIYKWELFSMHGHGAASTPEGRIKLLKKKAEFHSANIYTMGHVHDLQNFYDYEVVRDPETLNLKIKKRYYVICGSAMEYWNSYAEEWVLQPTKTGFAKIRLFCSKSKTPGDYDVIT